MISAQPKPLYTEEEYLALERSADERHEYLDGEVYAMAGESPEHGVISTNLIAALVTHLRGKDCRTFTKDVKVRSGPLPKSRLSTKGLYSYPDLVVVCGEMRFLDEYRDVLINPTVIIEVLSGSTEKFDRAQKFLRYQKYLPTLADYVLVSQEQPAVELYHRHSADWWQYTAVTDLAGTLHIPSIDCPLRLSEVYDRITFPPSDEEEAEPVQPNGRARGSSKGNGKRSTAKGRKAASPRRKK
jgi:Uma2 family endonuclease